MLGYNEDDYLLLSGIQHFAFCPRQWALIHIEGKWTESYLTSSGRVMHSKVHNESALEKRGNLIIARTLKISSHTLGVSGECDVVEFHKSDDGISLQGCDGLYTPFPIEYKNGSTKINDCDRLQLCAQAICLEEMLACFIPKGAIFYGKTKRREYIDFDFELRAKLKSLVLSMHDYHKRQVTPKIQKKKHCVSCSLKDDCLVKLKTNSTTVQQYLEGGLL